MSQFPRMIYQVGTQEEMHGGRFDYIVVEDQDTLDMLLADGWYLTTGEAKDAVAPKVALSEGGVLTRQQMEDQATALGIAFDGRTRDAKLMAMIDVAKEKKESPWAPHNRFPRIRVAIRYSPLLPLVAKW